MFPAGLTDSSWLLFTAAAGVLGSIACFATELTVVRFVPRLGGLPSLSVRIATAALTGVLCAALAFRVGMDWALPAFLVLAVLSVQLGRIDLAQHLLPNSLVLALLLAGLALFSLSSFASANWAQLLQAAAGAAILFITYLALALISPSGIGLGDVKLAAPVGLYLGHLGWTELFYGGALAFVLGGLAAVILLAVGRAKRSAEVAFGPAMLAAALATVLFTA